MTPRPKIYPFSNVTFKGSLVHPSPSGTISKWPKTPNVSSPFPYSTTPAYPSTSFVSKPSRLAISNMASKTSRQFFPKGAFSAFVDSSRTLSYDTSVFKSFKKSSLYLSTSVLKSIIFTSTQLFYHIVKKKELVFHEFLTFTLPFFLLLFLVLEVKLSHLH